MRNNRKLGDGRYFTDVMTALTATLVLCATAACGADLSNSDCSPACTNGFVCVSGQCTPGQNCMSDADCENDSYCQNGTCTPYGANYPDNPNCSRLVPAGLLSPSIFCEWLAPDAGDPFPQNMQVMTVPLVADFNFDGHQSSEFPTIKPSIVINTYNSPSDGACGLGAAGDGSNYGIIRILDGRTCKQQYVVNVHVNGAVTPAVGDIDGDGRPDILAYSADGGVVALSYDTGSMAWVQLWHSHMQNGTAHNPLAGHCEWAGPSLADLDNDGKPEALAEGYVYDHTGALIDAGTGLLPNTNGNFAVVADIDKDGVPNLVTASYALAWDKANARWASKYTYPTTNIGNNAYVAVADFGTVNGTTLDRTTRDGLAEVAVVSTGKAWLLSYDGKVVFGPVSLPGSTGGGPTTIGDFDNDGRPEFAAAGSDSYSVFDPDCVPNADPKYCATGSISGILWSQQSQDHSSNITGSSVFDFEGDGTAEAIYADECFARIYDGVTGNVLFSQQHSSCTWNEYPSIVDVQGNFRSKLIVPSNTNCNITCPAIDPVFKGLRCMQSTDCPNAMPCDSGFCRCTMDAQCNTGTSGGGFVCNTPASGLPGSGNTCQAAHSGARTGIRVFGDSLDRWVASRPMWNEHPYAVTNVTDNGVIPSTSSMQINWEQPGLNNFRLNVQGKLSPSSAPDATSQGGMSASAQCSGSMVTLSTSVCNRGSAPVGDGMPVTFYEGTTVLCTATTGQALPPGVCISVSCTGPLSGSGQHNITISANDDGTGQGSASECTSGNNKATMSFSC